VIPILEVSNISKKYRIKSSGKEKTIGALNNVSLSLHKGERLGVLGASGCGKTTLLKLILGMVMPSEGSIDKRVPAGFVAQDPYASLCHAMTVDKIITEPLIYGKKHRKHAQCESELREAMSWVNLDYDTFSKRYPHQLSGGERQRVSIARALIGRPGFLALDEPTSMVDFEVKSAIAKVILSASKAADCAILLVTHDIALAKELCDTILVIHNGEIIEYAPTEEILSRPQHAQTKKLILAGTDLRQYWAETESEVQMV